MTVSPLRRRIAGATRRWLRTMAHLTAEAPPAGDAGSVPPAGITIVPGWPPDTLPDRQAALANPTASGIAPPAGAPVPMRPVLRARRNGSRSQRSLIVRVGAATPQVTLRRFLLWQHRLQTSEPLHRWQHVSMTWESDPALAGSPAIGLEWARQTTLNVFIQSGPGCARAECVNRLVEMIFATHYIKDVSIDWSARDLGLSLDLLATDEELNRALRAGHPVIDLGRPAPDGFIPTPAHAWMIRYDIPSGSRRTAQMFLRMGAADFRRILAVSLPEDDTGEVRNGLESWLPILKEAARRHPGTVVCVLNLCGGQGRAAMGRFRWLKTVRDLGFGTHDAVALTEFADAYFGVLDVFGFAALRQNRRAAFLPLPGEPDQGAAPGDGSRQIRIPDGAGAAATTAALLTLLRASESD
ncbi:hypothetical protein [Azospirillum halopraeferens]|uniref:hypothetical protein n=1 Tax=Azospirillum halopraeferens TaxID=34010 RepID=UPI000429C5F2|nr:hypothetical protein [Azospirillum halopraeferens]